MAHDIRRAPPSDRQTIPRLLRRFIDVKNTTAFFLTFLSLDNRDFFP